MTASAPVPPTHPPALTARQMSRVNGVTLVLATPSTAPVLWRDYLDGARDSYAGHGVSAALQYSEVIGGENTALFFAALDPRGTVVGGVRAQGPYTSHHESHALLEWAGQPGLDLVTESISRRLPAGIVEMKTAWAAPGPTAATVASLLPRTALPTMSLTGARFIMATAADHVLRRWEASGGRVETRIPPAPYPNNNYRTRLMWWDRDRLHLDAEPEVHAEMLRDAAVITRGTGRQAD
ncbi:hypothetical protein ACTHRK_15675 [Dietzia cercidiphylli]|uniref:hypothetical protein n=1 Tax=Dietzia cercidiphylli TaxID=498199 RepID=UPI003F7F2E24